MPGGHLTCFSQIPLRQEEGGGQGGEGLGAEFAVVSVSLPVGWEKLHSKSGSLLRCALCVLLNGSGRAPA